MEVNIELVGEYNTTISLPLKKRVFNSNANRCWK